MSKPVFAHTGARLWSTNLTLKDCHWHYTDADTGELIGTSPLETGEKLVRDPHTGESMGLIQSDPRKPVTKEHARVAIEYLLGFCNEEDIVIASCVITLLNYINALEKQVPS